MDRIIERIEIKPADHEQHIGIKIQEKLEQGKEDRLEK